MHHAPRDLPHHGPTPHRRDAVDRSPRMPDTSAFDETHFQALFRDAPYYSTGRNWDDYAPAYRYGHEAHAQHAGRRFEEVEVQLARDWFRRKGASRLLWTEARGAVRDAWRRAGEHAPGRSADHPGDRGARRG